MAQLVLQAVMHSYGSHTVVDGVSFAVQNGTIACLLGPSGCGKTTLLRMLGGFVEPSAGRIELARSAQIAALFHPTNADKMR